MQKQLADSPQKYYFKLAEVVNLYSNIGSILEKLHRDNCLESITTDFEQILENEINYTISGKLTRT